MTDKVEIELSDELVTAIEAAKKELGFKSTKEAVYKLLKDKLEGLGYLELKKPN